MSPVKKKKDKRTELITTVVGQLDPSEDLRVWVVVIETKKLAGDLKMILAHIYDRDQLEFQASITSSIDQSDEKWMKADTGWSEYCVLTFSGREKNIIEKMKDFVSRSFSEGKLQDFIPFK